MLCLGPKKSLTSPRLELAAQGIGNRSSIVECEDHSAIQAPLKLNHLFNDEQILNVVKHIRNGGILD